MFTLCKYLIKWAIIELGTVYPIPFNSVTCLIRHLSIPTSCLNDIFVWSQNRPILTEKEYYDTLLNLTFVVVPGVSDKASSTVKGNTLPCVVSFLLTSI